VSANLVKLLVTSKLLHLMNLDRVVKHSVASLIKVHFSRKVQSVQSLSWGSKVY